MKMKTCELTGAALDWAVAACLGLTKQANWAGKRNTKGEFAHACWNQHYKPSTVWEYGGPIIEREGIWLRYYADEPEHHRWGATIHIEEDSADYLGPTPLIAAMRCFVAATKMRAGVDYIDIEIPEELQWAPKR